MVGNIYEEKIFVMAKKIVKLTEGDLRNVIREVVTQTLKQTSEDNTQNLPHSDDLFNLDTFPMEVLDDSYVRYEGYNLRITHRHPLSGIYESKTFKDNIEEVKRIMISTYPLDAKQFVIDEGHNGMYAAILISVIENNIDVIEEAMHKLGFFRSKPTDEKLLCDRKGRKWIDLRFEPTPSNDLTDYVRENYKYVYHLAPSVFEGSIKDEGLTPSNNNPEYKYYEPRVFVIKGDADDKSIQDLARELYQQAKQKGYSNLTSLYSLFAIDLNKIDKNVHFYGDINEEEGLFITSPIKPQAITKISEINASKTI